MIPLSEAIRSRFWLTLCIILVHSTTLLADDFVVSSNADAGPGSLREALTKASDNGESVQDRILFNLPGSSEADLTISILTQLPSLTSNLSIDATTQPGKPYSFSEARVIIKSTRQPFNHFKIFKGAGLHNLEFFGIYFWDTNRFGQSDPDGPVRNAIDLLSCENITIGKYQKGNSFDGYNGYTLELVKCRNVKIAANTFTPKVSAMFDNQVAPIHIDQIVGLEFGGKNEGNALLTSVYISLQNPNEVSRLVFTDNNFGVYADGETTSHIGYVTLRVQSTIIKDNDPKSLVDISYTGNLFSHFGGVGLDFKFLKGQMEIKHNWFGTDRAQKLALNLKQAHPGSGTTMVFEAFDGDLVVGDTDPENGNVIAYATYGVSMRGTANLQLMRNSFKCIQEKELIETPKDIPVIEVLSSSPSSIKGKSSPQALVDLFLSDDCTKCSPQTYIGSTNSDASGNWEYTYSQPIASYVIANCHVGKRSSNFSKVIVNQAAIAITHSKCGSAGSIQGIVVSNTTSIKWIDQKGAVVSTSTNLTGVAPGQYKLIAGLHCPVETAFLEIRDLTPIIYDFSKKISRPTCGKQDGSVTGLAIVKFDPTDQFSFSWTDAQQNEVATSQDLKNVGPGIYSLKVKVSSGCQLTYGPIILDVQGAPAINQSNQKVVSALCGSVNGAITGISATGTGPLSYSWRDAADREIGNSKDITSMAAGTYILRVTDGSNCGPAFSLPVTIPELNGVTITDANAVITDATCGGSNGSISNITTTGVLSYQWKDASGTVIASTPQLQNVPAGKYILTAIGSTCLKKSREFTINSISGDPFSEFSSLITPPLCGSNNGSIEVMFGTGIQPSIARWVNQSGTTVGYGNMLGGLDAGTYTLYLTNNAKCENLFKSYTLTRPAILNVSASHASVHPDFCEEGTGSVSGLAVTGGTPPYNFAWKDNTGSTISTNSEVTGMHSGSYELFVSDASGASCNRIQLSFSIPGQSIALSVPQVLSADICAPGDVQLKVQNPDEGSYEIFAEANGGVPLAESASGIFNVSVASETEFYVLHRKGNCVTERAPVRIRVSDSGLKTSGTITPNGDGINDVWVISSIENYPAAVITIFNRNGEKVFHSTGYHQPFTGEAGSRQLPTGTYFYFIDLKAGCKPMTGSLTIIR